MTITPRTVRLRSGVQVVNGITGETGPTFSEYVLLSDYEELQRELAALRHFVCHHGGLINAWGREWKPDKHPPLTEFIAERLDATIKELSL